MDFDKSLSLIVLYRTANTFLLLLAANLVSCWWKTTARWKNRCRYRLPFLHSQCHTFHLNRKFCNQLAKHNKEKPNTWPSHWLSHGSFAKHPCPPRFLQNSGNSKRGKAAWWRLKYHWWNVDAGLRFNKPLLKKNGHVNLIFEIYLYISTGARTPPCFLKNQVHPVAWRGRETRNIATWLKTTSESTAKTWWIMKLLHACKKAWSKKKYRSWVPRKQIRTGVMFALHWFISLLSQGEFKPAAINPCNSCWTSLNLQHISCSTSNHQYTWYLSHH